jgi:hypothetical protein
MSSNRPTSSTVRPPCILVNGGWCRCFPGGRRSPAHRRGRAAATSPDAARHERNERAGVEAECSDVVEAGTTVTTRMPHRLCRLLAGRSRLQPARYLRNCLLQPVIPGRSQPWRPLRTGLSRRRSRVRFPSLPSSKSLETETFLSSALGLEMTSARSGWRLPKRSSTCSREVRHSRCENTAGGSIVNIASRSAHRPRPIRETGGDADAATRSCGP